MKKMTYQKMIAIGLLITAIILSVVSWNVLPDTVITQIGIGGSKVSKMPKAAAVLMPAALSGLFSIVILVSKNENKKNGKSLFLSLFGIAIFIIMLIVNR